VIRQTRRALIAAVVVVAAISIWWRLTPLERRIDGVVLVTLDTTRADRLSPYGFMDLPMPALDRLAREGVVFDRAQSVAPLTLPAHSSLFTGLYPPAHGVRDNLSDPLGQDQVTLAEVLAERGFRTAAFVGSAVLLPDRGLNQGFDVYSPGRLGESDSPLRGQRRADAVVDETIAWLQGVGESPFFLWTHLYDAHRPYDPPPPFHTMADPYVGEIGFADSQLGRLLDEIDRLGMARRTIVVVVGDHGESLGERGERDHGIFVYENVLRVPLIMRVPGLAPHRVAALVRIVDVMPTILGALGLDGVAADGVDLADLLTGRRRDLAIEAYAESVYPRRLGWSPLRVWRDGRYKVIDAPRPELFDLERDPFEQHDIHDREPALARAMIARARAVSGRSMLAGTRDVPSDIIERLGALGYVAGPARSVSERELPDPKDCIGAHGSGARAPGRRCE
jgi:arylsulfatase A-like enzyme